jgi:hypothetical protein
VGDESHFLFRQKLLDEDGSVRRDVVIVRQPDLFSPFLSSEPAGMSRNQLPPPRRGEMSGLIS